MKTVGVTDYTNQPSPKHYGWENMFKFNTPKIIKMIKYAQIESAHLQCVNNH